jgi:hypothetical protein
MIVIVRFELQDSYKAPCEPARQGLAGRLDLQAHRDIVLEFVCPWTCLFDHRNSGIVLFIVLVRPGDRTVACPARAFGNSTGRRLLLPSSHSLRQSSSSNVLLASLKKLSKISSGAVIIILLFLLQDSRQRRGRDLSYSTPVGMIELRCYWQDYLGSHGQHHIGI